MFDGETEINLNNKGIDNERAKKIAAELKGNSTTHIDLFGKNVGNEGAVVIDDEARKVLDAAYVAYKEKITASESIDYKTLIDSQDANALTNALATTKLLKLCDTKIGVDDIKVIAAALANNDTITTIRLVRNNIDDDGAKEIATALATNKTLTTLDLTQNKISDGGALALADMLGMNENLSCVMLSSNGIGDGGAKRIATALATNRSVIMLDFTHNEIGNDGALALADVFLTNKVLKHINMSGNKGFDEYSSILKSRSDPICIQELRAVRTLSSTENVAEGKINNDFTQKPMMQTGLKGEFPLKDKIILQSKVENEDIERKSENEKVKGETKELKRKKGFLKRAIEKFGKNKKGKAEINELKGMNVDIK